MPQTVLEIRGVDPLLFRDGRPFTAESGGLTASSLPLPYPPTVAGFVRTQYGRAQRWEWSAQNARAAEQIPVHGPLLIRDGQVLLPAPTDSLFLEDHDRPIRLIPSEQYAGLCDLPEGLRPIMPIDGELADGKPRPGHKYWPAQDMIGWLQGISPPNLQGFGGLPEEERIGIAIQDKRAQEGKIYTALLRSFGEFTGPSTDRRIHEYTLLARAELPGQDSAAIATAGTLGGERRLTVVHSPGEALWPQIGDLASILAASGRVRMVLATPAHFAGGWRPGWIDGDCIGTPPTIPGLHLKLVGVAAGRRAALSGWGLNAAIRKGIGPAPVRWLAPAGAVYFFDVENKISETDWQAAWLQPVSDQEQDRRNGLGLALWGTW